MSPEQYSRALLKAKRIIALCPFFRHEYESFLAPLVRKCKCTVIVSVPMMLRMTSIIHCTICIMDQAVHGASALLSKQLAQMCVPCAGSQSAGVTIGAWCQGVWRPRPCAPPHASSNRPSHRRPVPSAMEVPLGIRDGDRYSLVKGPASEVRATARCDGRRAAILPKTN